VAGSGKPPSPGRLNDIRHIIYKDADGPAEDQAQPGAHDPSACQGEYRREGAGLAHNLLLGRPDQRAHPDDDSDGAAGRRLELPSTRVPTCEHHLRQVIEEIESRSPSSSSRSHRHDVKRIRAPIRLPTLRACRRMTDKSWNCSRERRPSPAPRNRHARAPALNKVSASFWEERSFAAVVGTAPIGLRHAGGHSDACDRVHCVRRRSMAQSPSSRKAAIEPSARMESFDREHPERAIRPTRSGAAGGAQLPRIAFRRLDGSRCSCRTAVGCWQSRTRALVGVRLIYRAQSRLACATPRSGQDWASAVSGWRVRGSGLERLTRAEVVLDRGTVLSRSEDSHRIGRSALTIPAFSAPLFISSCRRRRGA